MHAWTESPGFFPLTLYIAEPASLSAMTTDPDANWLLLLEVVLENAPNVPTPTSEHRAPSTSSVRRTFRLRSGSSWRAIAPPAEPSTAPGEGLTRPNRWVP